MREKTENERKRKGKEKERKERKKKGKKRKKNGRGMVGHVAGDDRRWPEMGGQSFTFKLLVECKCS